MNQLFIFCQMILLFPLLAQAQSFDLWYQSLSPEEKVSRIFVTGLRGASLLPKEKELLQKYPLSGFIFFKRNLKNIKQFKKLKAEIDHVLKHSYFSFTDQEGGKVVRIGSVYDSPPALAVGNLKKPDVSKTLGYAYGSTLRSLNINTNLAPVVDVKSKDSYDFISNRSYGSDVNVVSDMSLNFSKGLIQSGIIPTLKHFPGIGGIEEDSHKEIQVKKQSLKNLLEKEWLPYIEHQKSNLPFFVMSSHTQLILDDKDLGVVTYSKKALEHLRNITSQDQVILTDDLEMKGAKQENLNFPQSALKSFLAGHDLLLVGWSGKKLEDTLNLFLEQEKSNPEFQTRLKESLKRLYSLSLQKDKMTLSSSFAQLKESYHIPKKLNSKISSFFLDKNFKESLRNPAQEKTYSFFSSDSLFRKTLGYKLSRSLLRTPKKDILKSCKKNLCLLHLTGQKTAKKIQELITDSGETSFLILNSYDPSILEKVQNNRVEVINVFTRSTDLGKQVKELFLKGAS